MDQAEKREIENELMAMGLPGLDSPELIQGMADMVNGFPIPGERVDFFCELLNECEGAKRLEMYEALRPRLSFDVPSLDGCEARIAARAERLIRPRLMPGSPVVVEEPEFLLDLECGGCGKKETYAGRTPADAMSEAKKSGWGRGPRWPEEGAEHCAECRLLAMPVMPFGKRFSGRLN